MSKDRFSSDHTIQIVGETQTLNVGRHLNVLEDLDVGGDITVVGVLNADSGVIDGTLTVGTDLTITDDVIVGDGLVVGGNISSDSVATNDYAYISTKQIMRWIPISVLSQAIAAGSISGTNTAADSDGGNSISDYPTVLIGHSTLPTWHIFIPVDPFIPNGASIDEVVFFVENTISVGASDFEVNVESFSAAGSTAAFTVLGTDTAVLAGIADLRTILRFAVDTSVIDQDLLTPTCVRVKFEQTDSTEANVLAIFKMGLLLNVESVEEAFGMV